MGLEPTIFCSVGRRVIHYATRLFVLPCLHLFLLTVRAILINTLCIKHYKNSKFSLQQVTISYHKHLYEGFVVQKFYMGRSSDPIIHSSTHNLVEIVLTCFEFESLHPLETTIVFLVCSKGSKSFGYSDCLYWIHSSYYQLGLLYKSVFLQSQKAHISPSSSTLGLRFRTIQDPPLQTS